MGRHHIKGGTAIKVERALQKKMLAPIAPPHFQIPSGVPAVEDGKSSSNYSDYQWSFEIIAVKLNVACLQAQRDVKWAVWHCNNLLWLVMSAAITGEKSNLVPRWAAILNTWQFTRQSSTHPVTHRTHIMQLVASAWLSDHQGRTSAPLTRCIKLSNRWNMER